MKFKTRFISAFIGAVFVLSALTVNTVGANYYIADTCRNNTATDLSPVSGWSFDKSGGAVTISSENGVLLNDTSYVAPVSMRKKISPISSGSFTFDMLFSLQQYTDGFSVGFSGNGQDSFKVITIANELYLVGQNGTQTKLTAYTKSANIGLRLIVDLDMQSVTAIVDGREYLVADINTDSIDEIFISTSDKYKMKASISSIELYSGYALNERFIASGNPNSFPQNWNLISGSEAYIYSQKNTAPPDTNSLYVGVAGVETTFNETGDKGRFEFQFIPYGSNSRIVWKNGANEVVAFNISNGSIMFGNEKIADYKSDVWYRCELEADFITNTAKIMINGKYVKENISIPDMKIAGFSVSNNAGYVLVDDILAYTDTSDEYTVPAPVVPEKDDVNIGVMRCDIWREGNHFGWDKIRPYSERKTYLGYYDDGNPDVSDWETKWLSEHGIDYSFHCWYLPRPYSGGPIKTPKNAFAIEDGYFHSKYSDKIDFAIMWENALDTAVTSQMFQQYIVPYWIEHYLKDSRYMVVNNKPIIGIYSVENFLQTVGGNSTEQAKANLNYLREECSKLGYDGAYILCVASGSDVSVEKEMGFDAFHPYTWRDSTNNPQTQKKYLQTAMGNESNMEFVPVVSVGIDEEAWGKEKGEMCSPATVESVLTYVKDTNELLTVGEMGKMLLLDNWNEYGEGHYMMPAEKYGFGYLDAVRNVFVGTASHTDVKPSENEKKYLGNLYSDWLKPVASGEITVPIGSEVVKEWSGWLSMYSWSKGGDMNSASVSWTDGILTAKSKGDDPQLSCDSGLSNLSMKNVNYVAVEISRDTQSPSLALYFKNPGDQSFTEEKSIYVYARTDGEYETVYIPVWKNSDFAKGITALRLDPSTAGGTFKIKSIKILKGEPGDRIQLVKNSTDVLTTVPILKSNNEYFISIDDATSFGVNVSYLRDKELIKLVKENDIYEYTKDGSFYKNGVLEKGYSSLTTYGKYYMLPINLVADITGYEVDIDNDNEIIYMNSRDLYPEISYNISSDLENGLWKYRNLVEEPECDALGNYWWKTDASELKVTGEAAHSGNNSIYKDFDAAWKRMGVEADFKADTDYHISFWMKNKDTTDSNGLMRLVADYDAYDKNGNRLSYNQNAFSGYSFTLTPEWQYFNKDFRIEDYKKNNEMYSIGEGYIGTPSRIYVTEASNIIKRVYMDDVSIREIPSFRVYTKNISHISDKIGEEPIIFTFSHDIDPWTVTPDNIKINGNPATSEDLTIDIQTDEQTRETKLEITLTKPISVGATYTISLPNIRDAWGREIIGLTETKVIGGKPYLKVTSETENSMLNLSVQLMGENQSATAILAVKNKGALEFVEIYPLTQENNDFEFSIDINPVEWENIELFLLNDIKQLVPLSEKKTINIEQFITNS